MSSPRDVIVAAGKVGLSLMSIYYGWRMLMSSRKKIQATRDPRYYDKCVGDLVNQVGASLHPGHPYAEKMQNALNNKYTSQLKHDKYVALGYAAAGGLLFFGAYRFGQSVLTSGNLEVAKSALRSTPVPK
jgi:hypothetical protein